MPTFEVPLEPVLLGIRGFVRILSLLAFAPWPKVKAVPAPVLGFLAALLTPLAWLGTTTATLPAEPADYLLQIAGDLALGAAVGLSMQLIFAAASAGAALSGLQMGLTLGAVADPETGQRREPISRIYEWVLIALMITSGLHREMFLAIGRLLSLDHALRLGSVLDLVRSGELVFTLGLRLGAPVVACLFMTDVVLGLVARLVPKAQGLAIAYPAKLLTGLAVISLVLPITLRLLMGWLGDVPDWWLHLAGSPAGSP